MSECVFACLCVWLASAALKPCAYIALQEIELEELKALHDAIRHGDPEACCFASG